MIITILCDQTDCTFNTGYSDHPIHPINTCTHPHPAIQKWGDSANWSKVTCNSKDKRVVDPPIMVESLTSEDIFPIKCTDPCDKCDEGCNPGACDHCMNIPPEHGGQ